MKTERVTLRIHIRVPSRLIDLLLIPIGAVWITGMLVFDALARDESGRLP